MPNTQFVVERPKRNSVHSEWQHLRIETTRTLGPQGTKSLRSHSSTETCDLHHVQTTTHTQDSRLAVA